MGQRIVDKMSLEWGDKIPMFWIHHTGNNRLTLSTQYKKYESNFFMTSYNVVIDTIKSEGGLVPRILTSWFEEIL